MCGIFGVVRWDGQNVDEALLREQTRMLEHRGPDGEGFLVRPGLGLGHKRLSIIDLEAGAQPMANEDESVWTVFNGEIYNFADLRRELEGLGHSFRTRSDTEVLVHGWEAWQEGVVERLRGMFAFAILDLGRRRLFLARDRLGIKPLVYHEDGKSVSFASEIKAILRDPAVDKRLDPPAVRDYFEYGYVPAPATAFRGISKLQPGHCVTIDLDRVAPVAQRAYWRPIAEPDDGLSEPEAAERLLALLEEAIRLRLIADVPLGAFLSGGMDSSTVVALMCRVATGDVNTFAIGFREEAFSEVRFARMLAERWNTNHVEFTVEPEIRDLLPRLVAHFDEPFADASAIPTYYVSKMARQRVKVALSGEGGDELFAGYRRYAHCAGMARFDAIPRFLRRLTFGAAGALCPPGVRGKTFLQGVSLDPDERFFAFMRDQYGRLGSDALFSDDLLQALPSDVPEQHYLRRAVDGSVRDPLARLLDLDLRTYLPGDILAKTDITSMMNSLEVRVPLLDHELVEFMGRVPPSLKLRDGKGKYLLKKVMEPLLPAEIRDRKKMGFGVPIRAWLASELRDLTHQYLLDRRRLSGCLRPEVLDAMVRDNEARTFESATGGKLWWALFFEMWYQDVLEGTAATPA